MTHIRHCERSAAIPVAVFRLSQIDPGIDGVNTWFVALAAASQGIKVAQSGLGGEEQFASYPSFADWIYFRKMYI